MFRTDGQSDHMDAGPRDSSQLALLLPDGSVHNCLALLVSARFFGAARS